MYEKDLIKFLLRYLLHFRISDLYAYFLQIYIFLYKHFTSYDTKGKKMPKIFLVTADTLQHGYTTSRLAREWHSEPFSAKSEANTV